MRTFLQLYYITSKPKKTKMGSTLSNEALNSLGKFYSIVGLILAIPFCLAFKSYLRFLDHLQLFFVFSLILTDELRTFSSRLSTSWIQFPFNVFYYCMPGDFLCKAGFPITFGTCLLMFLGVMRAFVMIQTCGKQKNKFEPVYTFFKAFTRWAYAPLSYYSVYYLILSSNGTSNSMFPSVTVLIVVVSFPIAQLIGYKVLQKHYQKQNKVQNQKQKQKSMSKQISTPIPTNNWKKWLQFFNFYRIFLICTLIALGKGLNNKNIYNIVYAVQVIYTIVYLIKNTFNYKIVGRIVFFAGQILMIIVFSLFAFNPAAVESSSMDLIAITMLFVMDLVYHVKQILNFCKYGLPNEGDENQMAKVMPEVQENKFQVTGFNVNNKNMRETYEGDLKNLDSEIVMNNSSRMEFYERQNDFAFFKKRDKGYKKDKKKNIKTRRQREL